MYTILATSPCRKVYALTKTSQQLGGQFTKFREYYCSQDSHYTRIFHYRVTAKNNVFLKITLRYPGVYFLFWAMQSLSFGKIHCIEIPLTSRSMVSIQTPNPKCRLYWCFIETGDWIYSQSCWYFDYFRPLLWTSATITFSLVHLPPLPLSLCVNKYRGTCIHTVCNRGWGRGSGASGQINICRQVPLLFFKKSRHLGFDVYIVILSMSSRLLNSSEDF